MFGTLLESAARRRRRKGIALLSVAAHAVALAVASAGAHVAPRRPPDAAREVPIMFAVSPPPPSAPRTGAASPGRASSVEPIAGPAPSEMPTIGPVLVDPVDPMVGRSAGEPLGRGLSGSSTGSGPAAVVGNPVYEVVERAARPLPGSPQARYPEALRQASLEGSVVLRFVVDTTGRVEVGSVVAVRSTHPLFTEAARRTVVATRFEPAEAGGRRVRQLVEQSFAFALDR